MLSQYEPVSNASKRTMNLIPHLDDKNSMMRHMKANVTQCLTISTVFFLITDCSLPTEKNTVPVTP